QVGLKAFVLFELLSTLALAFGLALAHLLQPGAGLEGTLEMAGAPAPGSAPGPADLTVRSNAAERSMLGTLSAVLQANLVLQALILAIVCGALLTFHTRVTVRLANG